MRTRLNKQAGLTADGRSVLCAQCRRKGPVANEHPDRRAMIMESLALAFVYGWGAVFPMTGAGEIDPTSDERRLFCPLCSADWESSAGYRPGRRE